MRFTKFWIASYVLFICLTTVLYSQTNRNEDFKSGEIKGRIIDGDTKQGLTRASATLLRQKDSTIAGGAYTDEHGNLLIEKIHSGKYLLRINYVGYQQLFIESFTISSSKPTYNFGTIELNQTSQLTDEITITADKDVIQFQSGKRVINVDQDIASKGGNALDVLKNAPSVNVDIDGNVALRGSGNVNILINGKPTTFLGGGSSALEQLPADIIDHIEIITNPSAKYEAEGATGILNIVLKEERDSGLNGLVNINIGTQDRYSSSLNLNYKVNGINLFASYSFNRFIWGMGGTSNRVTQLPAVNDTSLLFQTSDRNRAMLMHNVKAGFEWNLDKNQSLIISGSYRPRFADVRGYTLTNQSYVVSPNIDTVRRSSYEDSHSPNFDFSANYRLNFDKEHYLTSDLFYSTSNDDEFTDYDQYLSYDPLNNALEKSISIEKDKSIVYQIDYSNKFNENFKIESGIRASSVVRDTKFDYNNQISGNWQSDTARKNYYEYNENIMAGYFILSADFNALFLQAGLRAENSNIIGDLTNKGMVNSQTYFNLFPSANISYKFSPALQVQANYSQRITRPRGWSLNPWTDYTDIYTIRSGNPNLKPEYSNLFELGTIHNIGGIAINPGLFYRFTDNVMERYQKMISDSVILSTWENMAKSQSYGIELNLNGPIFKWMRFNGDISYYNYKIEGIDASRESRQDYTWSSRLSFNMLLSKQFNLQVSGYYTAPTVTAQGSRSESYSVDAGLRYDILEDLSLSLRASDIFDTQKFYQVSSGPGFTYNFDMKRMTQFISLGIQYKINQGIKQKERRSPDENNQQNDDF
ncbi:MAG TPA: outer membrane beta-barrel family protein [Candidatus Kapabacteria bacterium]|nr:outer membrane beta-barrel family protein [Candidatus Kapabacteria bacterium]